MKANGIGSLALGLASLAAPPAQAAPQVIELKPGEYVYSCPLNPTPDCRLIVGNRSFIK
jgi:hypothetical protein